MNEKESVIRTPDGEMTTFIVHPDGAGLWPVPVLYMDGVGYREQVKQNARRFAAGGYFCVLPDLFYRSGKGVTVDFGRMMSPGLSESEREQMMRVMQSATPDRAVADTETVLQTLEKDPAASPGPIVCVGYCMGARFALHAAAALSDRVVATACIHPSALHTDAPNSPHHDLPRVRGELYVAFAENDRSANEENIGQFRGEMARLGVRGTVERVPGVAHGFSMADLPVYNRDASERHFERTLDLWRRNLSGQLVGTA
jgi:carboxymethylenebutenolidase